MKQNKPFDALFDADDQTISRIAAQCEPDWDENELFERSYRKYQAKRSGKILRIPRRIEHEPLRAIVTAACLMIAIGGAGSIWFFRYGVQKPDMTVELEAAPTEQTTSAETTTVTAAQTETAAASAATTRPETVYLVPEEAMELHTTAPATTLVPASSATKAVTSAVTASRTTAAASTVPTAQQSTAAVTVGAPGTVSRQETQTVPAQRPSAQTTAAKTSETAAAPVQTTTAKHEDAAAAATETFPAPGSGDNPTPAEPVGDMEEPAPVEGGDLPANPIEPVTGGTAGANGRFTFQEENGWSKVTFTADRVIAVDKVKVTSTLDSYVLEELDSHDTYSRLFQIKDPVTGDNCQIRHRSYDGFSGSFKIDEMELKEVTINGRPGYLMWVTGQTHTDPDGNDNLYTLFWDDGTGISMISDVDAGGKNMIKIAESIITTTE